MRQGTCRNESPTDIQRETKSNRQEKCAKTVRYDFRDESPDCHADGCLKDTAHFGEPLPLMLSKTFTLDWDSPREVNKLFYALRDRRGELKNDGITSGSNSDKFASIIAVWETDITVVYKEQSLDERRCYYVYAHLDPLHHVRLKYPKDAFAASLGLNSMPFYIGKGEGARDSNIQRNETHRKIVSRIHAAGKEVIVKRLLDNLTEREAFAAEAKLIDIFGLLVNGGMLTNLDEGHRAAERRGLYDIQDLFRLNPVAADPRLAEMASSKKARRLAERKMRKHPSQSSRNYEVPSV